MATAPVFDADVDSQTPMTESSLVSSTSSFKKHCDDPLKMTPYVMKYSKWKWIVLVLGGLVTFGDWYCMDNVAVLEQQLYDLIKTDYLAYS